MVVAIFLHLLCSGLSRSKWLPPPPPHLLTPTPPVRWRNLGFAVKWCHFLALFCWVSPSDVVMAVVVGAVNRPTYCDVGHLWCGLFVVQTEGGWTDTHLHARAIVHVCKVVLAHQPACMCVRTQNQTVTTGDVHDF